jgi:hypothetical protein
VESEHSWPKVLEAKLRAASHDVEIANLGEPGVSPSEYAEIAERAVPLINASLIHDMAVQSKRIEDGPVRSPMRWCASGLRRERRTSGPRMAALASRSGLNTRRNACPALYRGAAAKNSAGTKRADQGGPSRSSPPASDGRTTINLRQRQPQLTIHHQAWNISLYPATSLLQLQARK